MAVATRLFTRASGPTLDGNVRIPSKFFIIAGAFALGQVLNFGSRAYVADCYRHLRPLNGATPVCNELSVPPLPPDPLRADLKVLA